MKRRSWLDASARKRFAETVAAIEARTSAELVVTVRERSGSYRHIDLGIGAAFAFVALVVYVYAPIAFDDGVAVPSIVMAFAGGALLASVLDVPKRVFVPTRVRDAAVRAAARACFVEQGVSATRERTGILVYVSLLENAVEVVTDLGVRPELMGAAWTEAVARLATCAHRAASPDALAEALLRLAEPLAVALPRRDDDLNELPDGVVDDGEAS